MKNWIRHAYEHPLTTAVGALGFTASLAQYLYANREMSGLDLIFGGVIFALGAAMRDPGK